MPHFHKPSPATQSKLYTLAGFASTLVGSGAAGFFFQKARKLKQPQGDTSLIGNAAEDHLTANSSYESAHRQSDSSDNSSDTAVVNSDELSVYLASSHSNSNS